MDWGADEKKPLVADNSTQTLDAKEGKDVKHRVVICWHYSKTNEPHRVYVCGSWDGWDSRLRLHKSDDIFSTVLHLSPGYYEYKFCVDNEWLTNEHLPFTDVGYYSRNIITVKEEEGDAVEQTRTI
ncbi:unnamed protein product [Cylicocyclus nassatus]|uniref:5'-AMP-activated protein kinase subunit beta-1 n=1 Tax=Cylicocyclus nassatus TaxID=53992 RepID=A0AA36MGI7_CYLNA|nr:unnamed protein product [Cylicocyclus nassatus]